MKNLIKQQMFALILLGFMAIAQTGMTQAPPPPPSDKGTSSNKAPAGGGAPIEGGLFIALAMVAGFGAWKLSKRKKMKKVVYLTAMMLFIAGSMFAQTGNVGINNFGTSPDASAMLDVSSTTKGFLPPRMTTTQIIAIQNPANGLIVFNTTDEKMYAYSTTAATWKEINFGTGTILVPSFVCGQAFTDSRDSKSYNSVLIGTQCWMADNLAYLPSLANPFISSGTNPYYYVYDCGCATVALAKATTIYQTYGVQYNWPAAVSACPTGWHLPGNDEWTTLAGYLGGLGVAGGIMKETGTPHWNSPNEGATNSSGFTGLPAGKIDGGYALQGQKAYFWSATQYNTAAATFVTLEYLTIGLNQSIINKALGYSVRCLKD